MAKKLGFDLGNREIKAAKKIENTHAQQVSNPVEKKKSEPMPKTTRKQRAKKDWKVASIRLERSDFKQVEAYMIKHDISFNALVRELLEEKEVIK